MMLRASWKSQPASRAVRAGFIGELALEDEELGTVRIRGRARVCLRAPMFEEHAVCEARLLVEILMGYARNRTCLPRQFAGIHNDVGARATGELP